MTNTSAKDPVCDMNVETITAVARSYDLVPRNQLPRPLGEQNQ